MYTAAEYVKMIVAFRESVQNAHKVETIYVTRFLDRSHINHKVILKANSRMQETG